MGSLALLLAGDAVAKDLAFRGSDGLEPTLAVIGLEIGGVSEDAAGEYRDAVGAALASSNTLALLDAASVSANVGSRYGSAADLADRKKEFLKTLQKGEDLAFDDPASSIEVFQESRALFRSMSGVHDVDPDLRDRGFAATMQLGFAYLESQDRESAVRVLHEGMVEFGSDMEVTDAVFHPSLVTLYQGALASLADAPRGTLVVEGAAEDDAILINGTAAALSAPATVEGLLPGDVRVQLVREGKASSPVLATVVAGQITHVVPTLALDVVMRGGKGGAGFASIQAATSALPGLARDLSGLTGADVIALVGIVDRGGSPHLAGFLVDGRTGDVVAATPRKIKRGVFSNKRVMEASSDLLSGAGLSSFAGGGGQWHTSIVGWSLTGVGVVGLAVAGVFAGKWSEKNDDLTELLDDLGPEPSAKGSPVWNNWNKEYQGAEDIQAEAQQAETIAWASGITGLVAIGAGVAFFVMEGSASSTADTERSPRSFFAGPMLSPAGEPGVGMSFSGSF